MRRFALGLLVSAFAGLVAAQAWLNSPIWHEPAQLMAGLVGWQYGRSHTITVNPPLVRHVAALPVVVQSPVVDERLATQSTRYREEFSLAAGFVQDNDEDFRRMLVAARWACILFALVGAYVCWRFSASLFGPSSGLIALVLWCFSPYILGHSATVMPDVAAAAMGAAAGYCFWRWLRRPRWLEAIVAALVLGLAALCKFTLLVFYIVLPLMWIAYRLPVRRGLARRVWLRQGGMLAALLLISVHVINCGYLFEGTFTPLGKYRFRTTILSGSRRLADVPPEGANRFAGTWLGTVPVPLPANMVQGIDTQRYDFERGLPSYLGGQWADHGWWFYYLYALVIKVPLGTGCLLALAMGVTVFGRRYSASWPDEMVVLVPGFAILILVSSQTGFSIHSRYVIPALPFFIVWASKEGRVFEMRRCTRKRQALAAMVVVGLAWSVTSSLWAYPHSLSYFNELVGGPKHGGEHLLDSNIDWGQDLSYLADWLDDHPEVKLDGLAYFGSYPATLAGIPETPRPPRGPETTHGDLNAAGGGLGPKPGWYALSVNYLYGRSRQYRYFLQFEPVGSAGYSIYIYHVTPEQANRVRRALGAPQIPEAKADMDRRRRNGARRGDWNRTGSTAELVRLPANAS